MSTKTLLWGSKMLFSGLSFSKASALLNPLKNIVPRIPSLRLASSSSKALPNTKKAKDKTKPEDDCSKGVMQFFDPDYKENFHALNISTGRPWELDELRIKSNQDLHKLWYVLLKERNMLMTMEEWYSRELKLMPSPQRMDKVEHSMENILQVIHERDDAISLLEKGVPKERPAVEAMNFLGLVYFRKPKEHLVPKLLNRRYRLLHLNFVPPWMKKYLYLYREKVFRLKRKENKFRRRYQRTFSDLPEDVVQHGLEEELLRNQRKF